MSDISAAKLRFRVKAGVGIVLLSLIGIAIIAYRDTYQILGTVRQNTHSRAVLLQVQKAVSDLTDAETSQRGYLYTGRQEYLRPYDGARARAFEGVAVLQSITANDAEGYADSIQLRNMVELKMQELQRTIDLYKSGQTAAARNVVLSGEGIELMGRIRAVAQKMYDRESQLLENRSTHSRRSARESGIAFGLAAAMATVLVLVLGFSITRDLTRREQAEVAERKARREAEAAHEQNRQIVESITEGFAAVDRLGRVTYLNYQAAKVSGKNSAEALGQDIGVVFPQLTGSPLEKAWRAAMEQGTTSSAEAYFEASGRWLEIVAYPGSEQGITLLLRDVTDRRRRDEALMKAEKLAAAGRLSAGIAHEINNPLEAITNLLYIARTNPDRAQDCIRMAEQEVTRVAHITRQTLGFFRDVSSYAVIDLRTIADDVLELFSRKLKLKDIYIRKEFVGDVSILGQSGEIRQVLANLVANSIDALAKAGTLAIRVSEHHDWSNGNRPGIRITLADNGCGIAADQFDKIFEPFYTTKQDTGTGLGLWLSQSILVKHGGSLHFRSSTEPERRGTTFSIFLPKKAEDVFPGESIPELRKKPA